MIVVQNFHLQMETWEKAIIFGIDISSSVHNYNKNKNILIVGEGPTQRLDYTTLTAEAEYAINFSQPRKKFALSLL